MTLLLRTIVVDNLVEVVEDLVEVAVVTQTSVEVVMVVNQMDINTTKTTNNFPSNILEVTIMVVKDGRIRIEKQLCQQP